MDDDDNEGELTADGKTMSEWFAAETEYPDWIRAAAAEMEERMHGTYMWRPRWRAVVSEIIRRRHAESSGNAIGRRSDTSDWLLDV